MKKDLGIILAARKARKKRSNIPIEFFMDKYLNADDLLITIDKKIKRKDLKYEARKQYIISLVTAFEVYFKEAFILLIDEKRLDISKIKTLFNRKYDFEEVLLINKKRISAGELAASQFNFQELESIQKAFSSLLGRDFISELKRYRWIYGDRKNEFIQLDKDFYIKLERILNLRHNFTHDINFKDFISKKEIKDISSNLFTFVSLVNFFLSDYFLENE